MKKRQDIRCGYPISRFGQIMQHKFGNRYSFTVLTKLPDSKRGEYAEELDILADTVGAARKIAVKVLKEEYIPELRVSRILMNY